MIVTFLLTVAYGAYSLLLTLLPTGHIPSAISTSITTIVSYMYKFNGLLPIDTLFTVLALFVTVEVAFLGARVIVWVWARIPFIGSGT